MKKFSKITGYKIPNDPKIGPQKINESDVLKSKIIGLMDNYLKIQMYGPVTKYHVAGSMKIVGKELFLESIMDLIKESISKEGIKLLKELKSIEIDDKIEDLNESKSINSKLSKSRLKIKSLIDRYSDRESLMSIVDRNAESIKKGETAYWRSVAADELCSNPKYSSSICKEIADKYRFRCQQLGYKK